MSAVQKIIHKIFYAKIKQDRHARQEPISKMQNIFLFIDKNVHTNLSASHMSYHGNALTISLSPTFVLSLSNLLPLSRIKCVLGPSLDSFYFLLITSRIKARHCIGWTGDRPLWSTIYRIFICYWMEIRYLNEKFLFCLDSKVISERLIKQIN